MFPCTIPYALTHPRYFTMLMIDGNDGKRFNIHKVPGEKIRLHITRFSSKFHQDPAPAQGMVLLFVVWLKSAVKQAADPSFFTNRDPGSSRFPVLREPQRR